VLVGVRRTVNQFVMSALAAARRREMLAFDAGHFETAATITFPDDLIDAGVFTVSPGLCCSDIRSLLCRFVHHMKQLPFRHQKRVKRKRIVQRGLELKPALKAFAPLQHIGGVNQWSVP
jgi:hypothetical protein